MTRSKDLFLKCVQGDGRRVFGDEEVSREGFKALLQAISAAPVSQSKELSLLRRALASSWNDGTTLGKVISCVRQTNKQLSDVTLCYCHVMEVGGALACTRTLKR